jgi:hypothetical protein
VPDDSQSRLKTCHKIFNFLNLVNLKLNKDTSKPAAKWECRETKLILEHTIQHTSYNTRTMNRMAICRWLSVGTVTVLWTEKDRDSRITWCGWRSFSLLSYPVQLWGPPYAMDNTASVTPATLPTTPYLSKVMVEKSRAFNKMSGMVAVVATVRWRLHVATLTMTYCGGVWKGSSRGRAGTWKSFVRFPYYYDYQKRRWSIISNLMVTTEFYKSNNA